MTFGGPTDRPGWDDRDDRDRRPPAERIDLPPGSEGPRERVAEGSLFDDLPELPSRPPGGRIFSLEDRPAPGLYFLAWFLTVGAVALLLVGFLAAAPVAQGVLLLVALAAFTLGLSAAAGYQVLSRADRHPDAYRGPSPLIVFGVILGASYFLAVIVFGLGRLDPASPRGLPVQALVIGLGYLVTVLLFVIRTRALGWRDIVQRRREGSFAESLFVDVAFGIAVGLLMMLLVGIAGLILTTVLGVETPRQLPEARTAADWLLVALAAAVIAPIGEELFFRGFTLTAWQRDLGPTRALLRSALFFAIVHVVQVDADTASTGIRQAFLVFALILPVGLILGRLYQYRGLISSICGHATFNGIQLLVLIAASQAPTTF